MRRTDSIIGIDDQLVVIQIFTRYPPHLFDEADQAWGSSETGRMHTESYPLGAPVKWGALSIVSYTTPATTLFNNTAFQGDANLFLE